MINLKIIAVFKVGDRIIIIIISIIIMVIVEVKTIKVIKKSIKIVIKRKNKRQNINKEMLWTILF